MGVEHDLAVSDLHRDVGLVQVLVQLPGQDPGDDVAVLWAAEHLESICRSSTNEAASAADCATYPS